MNDRVVYMQLFLLLTCRKKKKKKNMRQNVVMNTIVGYEVTVEENSIVGYHVSCNTAGMDKFLVVAFCKFGHSLTSSWFGKMKSTLGRCC